MATESKADRKLINSVLTKLGVEHAGKLSNDRAEKKLGHRLQKQGTPDKLTEAEIAMIKDLGFNADILPTKMQETDKDETPEIVHPSGAIVKKVEKTKKSPAQKLDAGKAGKNKDTKAKKAAPEKSAKKEKAPTAPKAEKVVHLTPEQRLKGKNGFRLRADGSVGTRPIERKDGKPAMLGTGCGRKRGTGAIQAFKDAFESRKQYEKSELIALITKKGPCTPDSVWNYIALAKKDKKAFGFKLTQTLTKKGAKILTRS